MRRNTKSIPSGTDTHEPDPVAGLDAEARLHGARIATKCRVCGRWLVAPKSRAAHEGPKCRTRSTRGDVK